MPSEHQTILNLLKSLQSIQEGAFEELNGLFPSSRFHPVGYRRRDCSAYFTATLWHSLNRLKNGLTEEEWKIVEEIRLKACEGVAPFQNKQGRPRYNFWKTNPGKHFPNGYLLGRWDYFRPPDDVDDSVMIYQMQNRNRNEAFWLKEHIDSYANGSRKWIRNTPAPYLKLRAFSTFFSWDMPLGFDACVISNVLYFNLLFGFEKTIQDEDSMRYLMLMLERKDHIHFPERVSPYYPHHSIIVYHLAKLMERFDPPELQEYRQQLANELRDLMQGELMQEERRMVENAWMWLTGENPPPMKGKLKEGRFYFFVLPLTLEYEGWLPQWFAHKRISHLRFESRALELAFEVENRALRRRNEGQGDWLKKSDQ
jgi:hypothetical protein